MIGLEPDGGNLYRAHPLLIHSGRFWRCAHGSTGFCDGMAWLGCDDCAKAAPDAFKAWHSEEGERQ